MGQQFDVSVLDDLPIAFCIIRIELDENQKPVDWSYVYANEALTKINGVSKEMHMNHRFYDIFPNGDRKWLKPCYEAAYENRQAEIDFLSSKTNRFLHVTCIPVTYGCCACMLQDYTSIMEKVQGSIVNTNFDMFYYSPVNKRLSITPSLQSKYQFQPAYDSMVEDFAKTELEQESIAAVEHMMEAFHRGTESVHADCKLRSGHSVMIYLTHDGEEPYTAVAIGYVVDISARKSAENDRRQEHEKFMVSNRRERQYRRAITKQAMCVYDTNLSQDIVYDDVTMEADGQEVSVLGMVGLKAPCRFSEFFERWMDFVDEECREDYKNTVSPEALLAAVKNDKYDTELEYWTLMPDGKRHFIRQNFYMTQDELTGDYLVLAVVKDFTEEKNQQDEQKKVLEEALIQAQSASRSKSTFLSNISHDIRTPMNAIIGFTALATTHADKPDMVRGYLEKIMTSSNHLLSLINDVLDMSRIESGHMHIEHVKCNLSEIMHDMKTVLIGQVNAKQLEFYVDTVDVIDEDVLCDKLRLNQILLNLIGNSIKFTKPGGIVLVRVRQMQERGRDGFATYEFRVKDSGVGIREDFLEHIFEPFARAKSATLSGVEGTGLGMAITKNIVDMMNGTIEVHSKEDVGTEFIVTLEFPLQSEQEQHVSPCESEEYKTQDGNDDFHACDNMSAMCQKNNSNGDYNKYDRDRAFRTKQIAGKYILLVEDNPINREIAVEILKEYGCEVESAENGAVALEMLEHAGGGYYDVILMDIQMPVMNGYEATRAIRSMEDCSLASIPIIAMTANAFDEDKKAVLEAGMNGHIAKPIDIPTLIATLIEMDEHSLQV